jgi:hypothetical protein
MAKDDENGEGEQMRISITIDPSLRKKMRIAAAVQDLTVGEWSVAVLTRAADKAVPNLPRVKASTE